MYLFLNSYLYFMDNHQLLLYVEILSFARPQYRSHHNLLQKGNAQVKEFSLPNVFLSQIDGFLLTKNFSCHCSESESAAARSVCVCV